MRKLNEGRWETLEAKSDSDSARKEKKNWDKLEKQVIEEEEKAELEGDAAVNRLFQKIYKDADDDTKRAMIKSYVYAIFSLFSHRHTIILFFRANQAALCSAPTGTKSRRNPPPSSHRTAWNGKLSPPDVFLIL